MSQPDDNKFSPAWWLRGPHAQTLWSQYFRRRRVSDLQVEVVATPDGDRFHLYHRNVSASAPRILLLHGLEGSVRSHYIHGLIAQAQKRGWNASVLEFRGCGPELNVGRRLYHSGETSDLRLALRLLTERCPGDPVFLAGVSLGGNVLLKFLGEAPETVPAQVRAAAAVSVPFDLEAGCRYLQHGLARIYDRHFLKSLRRKAVMKLAQHPDLFDRERLERARTIEDFDDAVTAPVHGFAGSHDYYSRSSSIGFIRDIRIPTLLLSAADDPFLPAYVLDRVREVANANPKLHLQFEARGGHVGFIGGSSPFTPVHWAEDRLMRFFDVEANRNPAESSAVSF